MSPSLERKRLDVVERLRVRYPDALERVGTYLLSSASDTAGADDAQLELGWREVASACLDCGLLAIEQGDEWSGPIPPIVVVQERRAARHGIDLPTSMVRYMSAYRLVWDYVLEELGYSDFSEQDRILVYRQASMASLSLLGQLLSEVATVHLDKLSEGLRTPVQNDARLTCRLLAGEPINKSEIDYDFDAEHVGLVAWGDGAATALASIAGRLGYERWIVRNDDGTVWAWLSRSGGQPAKDVAKALDSDMYSRVFAAIGEPAPQLRGFRDTYRLAQAAYRVAKLSGQRITQYVDVAREARALQDPVHARWLIHKYVTPILEHREGPVLRLAVEKFCETERNAEKAGKLIGVDRHTINRRIEKVGKLIGRELRACCDDMELALSLAKLYEGADEDASRLVFEREGRT